MPKILLAVSGCSQAEHTARLVRSLQELPAIELIVAATPRALGFFEIEEVAALTGESVYVEHRNASKRFPVPHIHLAEWAELVVVFPASANTIARCAHGFSDTLVSNLVLAAKCPVYFGPSMNAAMLENPIVQGNLEKLKAAGYQLIPRVPTEVFTQSDQRFTVELACTEDTVKAICHHAFAD
ncbi:MAG: flavoprotein [Acidobacteriota bacterium]